MMIYDPNLDENTMKINATFRPYDLNLSLLKLLNI